MHKNLLMEDQNASSDLLGDAGNCRRNDEALNTNLLSDSVFGEQQKLRHVLDWAQIFLHSGSELHHSFCRTASLILDRKRQMHAAERKKSCQPLSEAEYQTPPSSAVERTGSSFGGQIKESIQKVNSYDSAYKQICSYGNDPRKRSMQANRNDPRLESYPSSGGEGSEQDWKGEEKKPERKAGETTIAAQNSKSSFEMQVNNNNGTKHNLDQTGKSKKQSFRSQLQIPTDVSVYEQYQLCVEHLRHLRVRQNQQTEREQMTDRTNPSSFSKCEFEKHLTEETKKRPTFEDIAKNPPPVISFSRYHESTLTEHSESSLLKDLETWNKENPDALHSGKVVNNTSSFRPDTGKHRDFLRRTAVDEHIDTQREQRIPQGGNNAPKTNPDGKGPQIGVKGQRTEDRGRGPIWTRQEKSITASISRPQSARLFRFAAKQSVQTQTRRHKPEGKATTSSAVTSDHTDGHDCKYNPAGFPACDGRLPDEVWLSILSLLPHSDLCRVAQVCHNLHRLASDRTLWKQVKIENGILSDWWLRCVGKHHPHSASLYNCSALSVTLSGLEMFLSYCRNSLKEIKVISCYGPGLHGDLVLPLIGQLCDHVTCVDMSWSGATDDGVKALSSGRSRMTLEAVILNGCQVTDDPLMKLIERHRGSLRRLEVFGCQSLTPPCLQTIFEMCPGLRQLNIGQVPKVKPQTLIAMTTQLKGLTSLNLTGLQVTQGTVDTLLQSCTDLQSLTLGSCPGVNDLTLDSISKYAPCIRSLDVSGCMAVSDVGVQSLVLACSGLEHLDVSSTGTGSRGVTLLANYCNRFLHTVKLSFCHISADSILKLCRRCKRLKVLHLYGCSSLPDEGEIRHVNCTVKVCHLPQREQI